MLKTLLVSSVLLTLLIGAAGVSAAAPREIAPGELTHQLNLQREQIQSSVSYELQEQLQGQLIGPAVNPTETPILDCDGTPDREQDQLHDRDRDRIYQSEPTGVQNHGSGQMGNGNGSKP